jgi:hypothetical protein
MGHASKNRPQIGPVTKVLDKINKLLLKVKKVRAKVVKNKS